MSRLTLEIKLLFEILLQRLLTIVVLTVLHWHLGFPQSNLSLSLSVYLSVFLSFSLSLSLSLFVSLSLCPDWTGTWASDFVDRVDLFFLKVLGEGLPATEAVGFDFFWKFIFDHPGMLLVLIMASPCFSTLKHHLDLMLGQFSNIFSRIAFSKRLQQN